MQKAKLLKLALVGFLGLTACNKEELQTPSNTQVSNNDVNASALDRDFSVALSRALSSDKSLALLLKKEAQKEFDNNTDVLYHQIKNSTLPNGKSVRDVILSHWGKSEREFTAYESAKPLLNIFASDLGLLAESLDLDNWTFEEGVAVANRSVSGEYVLYVAGDSVATIKSGQVPALPTFVVGENSRVAVASSLRSAKTGGVDYTYSFLNEAYDGSKNTSLRNAVVPEAPESDEWVSASELDRELINSWDASRVNGRLDRQRYLTYYGEGKENLRVGYNEYLYRFKVEPNAYHFIGGAEPERKDDPFVREDDVYVTRGGKDAPLRDIMNHLWSKGSYTFSFEVMTPLISGSTYNQQLVVSVQPEELFVFDVQRRVRSGNLFRRTKYIYSFNSSLFQSRWVYPTKVGSKTYARVDRSWDLSQQGTHKLIRVTEKDKGAIIEQTDTFSSEFIRKGKVQSSFKIFDSGVSSEIENNNRETHTVTSKYSYTDTDDVLGTLSLFFEDPVILGERSTSGKQYRLKNISNGTVTATFVPLSYR